MPDYYKIDPKLKSKMISPFLTPPAWARTPKRGNPANGHGIWEEPAVIEDWEFVKDEETGDERVTVRLRVAADTQTDNQGASVRETMFFPIKAITNGGPENLVQQFQISYKNLVAAYHAAGGEGTPDPGEIDPDEVRGARVTVTMAVAPDKKGIDRQNIWGWAPPSD